MGRVAVHRGLPASQVGILLPRPHGQVRGVGSGQNGRAGSPGHGSHAVVVGIVCPSIRLTGFGRCQDTRGDVAEPWCCLVY